ncbi:MAG: 4Fe-4S binding protein [Deltaproteobacteria bacterium]|nr:4Fe-4S binding protein [Deltaproteobacteria bacterium]
MSHKKGFSRLTEHMQEWIIGLPDDEEMQRLLEARISVEEADFLADFPFFPHTVDQLAEKFGTTVDEFCAKCDPLAGKGLIFRHESRNTIRYALNESMFMFYRSPFWAGKDDAKTKELARLSNRYFNPTYGREFGRIQTTGLRAIPVHRTIEDPRQIQPYEDVIQVVEKEDYICVAHCPCRQRMNLDPDSSSCEHETLNCLHFGRLARYMVKQEMGQKISPEETKEILDAAAEAGLVHGITGHKAAPDSICNCCSCCCLYLQSVHVLGLHGHQRSNYVASVKAKTCKGCGLCEKRCPMDAVRMEISDEAENETGEVAAVDTEKCIGCGVCAHKCPTQSMVLVHREGEEDFPETEREMAQRMARERGRNAFGLAGR